ncbi:hypothetical protein [Kamptonema formosum]|uniref:hypothetical protein n=1 Tax=Kamptonema formosum TaxID=331992 RepID=UPI0003487D87|nr:hypothetical protein [Oscillatoria sp. PCC 10802]
MSQLYTTAQAAENLGVSASTLRTWKSRKADRFAEGEHFISQEGQTLWTEAGVSVLRQIQSQNATPAVAQPQRQESQEPAENETGLEALLRPLATVIAAGGAPVLRRLILEESARQALAAPATTTECLTVLRQCGISPANPASLIAGSAPAGLLEGGDSDD